MKCETCLNSRTGISENGYHCVCTLSAKKAANCITNDYKHYVKSSLDIPKKPQTNADRILAMSDEELAALFEMIPHLGNPPTYTIDGFCIDDGLRTKRQWLDWLRQEAKT